MKHRVSLVALGCLLAALVAGCDSSSSTPKPATVNGVFADATVVGMTFGCGTQKGVTGAGGTFSCTSGDDVTFSVGGITVCKAPPLLMMTPVSCAQAADATANTSTPSVIAVARLLISISTTPPSSGNLTITAAELQAAASLTLDFSTATDAQLLTAVDTISPGASLIDATTAQNELIALVQGALAGNFSGTFSGADMGTWMVTVASDGSISGTATNSKGNTVSVAGSLVSGTVYSGTAGSAVWTGNMDTSQSPTVFSGTYTSSDGPGTFTGKKH
ncbi:MAG: hypothetical protein ACRD5M_01930 [Candidatus Acidiferrales bacterium]